jgi:hypothetical protein
MRKAPIMSELTVPSAPNSEFFGRSVPSLVYLDNAIGWPELFESFRRKAVAQGRKLNSRQQSLR